MSEKDIDRANGNSNFQVPAAILQSSKARVERLTSRQAEREAKKELVEAENSTRQRKKWSLSTPTTLEALHSEPPKNTLAEIQKIKEARELRRQHAGVFKEKRDGLDPRELAASEYISRIIEFRCKWSQWFETLKDSQPLCQTVDMSIQVCLRKRPPSTKELAQKAFDVVTTTTSQFPNAHVFVHEPKLSVDQTRTITTHPFQFDQVFDETAKNQYVYEKALKPLISKLFQGKNISLFCYGQTSSGKTHTLFGVEEGKQKGSPDKEIGVYYYACTEIYKSSKENDHPFFISFLELYSGKVFDLLNSRQPIKLLEKDGNFQFVGLKEYPTYTLESCLELMRKGLETRTTSSTDSNRTSSRSHAIFRLENRKTGSLLTLIDLAGSERAMDNPSSSKETRRESASINQSLLALKECIRALHAGENYIPYRSNKLTCVLRECFKDSVCVMMLNIAPTQLTIEQTLSCLHYAHRVKEYVKQSEFVETDAKLAAYKKLMKQKGWMETVIERMSLKTDASNSPHEEIPTVNNSFGVQQRGDDAEIHQYGNESEDDDDWIDSELECEGMAEGSYGETEREVDEDEMHKVRQAEAGDEKVRVGDETSEPEEGMTPSASRVNLSSSRNSNSSVGSATPDGGHTPQEFKLSGSLSTGNPKTNQKLIEFHLQVILMSKVLIEQEEELIKNFSESRLEIGMYRKQLDALLDDRLKVLFRLKALLLGD